MLKLIGHLIAREKYIGGKKLRYWRAVFDRTQYVVEKKLLTLLGLGGTYSVKDVNGNLLGYIKMAWWKRKIRFEGMDRTRQGEIRYGNFTYKVYDAQNQLRATIERAGGLGLRSDKWLMRDPQGQQLAIAESDFLRFNYRILAPDGSAVAQIHRRFIGRLSSYHIDISRQGFDPLLILSYVVALILQEETVYVPTFV
jgi:uncharacterized protein YxjI